MAGATLARADQDLRRIGEAMSAAPPQGMRHRLLEVQR